MSEKILTKHPQRKTGRAIDREKYDQIRAGILATVKCRTCAHHSESTAGGSMKRRKSSARLVT